MPRPIPALAAFVTTVVLLAGCSGDSGGIDVPAHSVVDAHEILITGADIERELDGAQALDGTEPFASTVDDYLAARASDIPPIDPEPCGDAVVDLVLLDRDAGAAGTVYTAPRIRLQNGYELVQTGREFAGADAAETWLAAYRAVLEGCPEFTVHLEDSDVRVAQTVTDAGSGRDGFVVRLEITGEAGTPTYNEQWVLRDGPFVVLASSATGDGDDAALLPAVDAIHARLVAAIDAAT
ncbi:MAG: hypothetical protein ABIQ01_08200 [Pseudolysinimonas sp.]